MNKSLFKIIPENVYKLHSERIDIWQFPLTDLPSGASNILNEEEQARAHRFYFPQHKRRFTIARAMLRFLLAAYLGEHPKNLVFSYNKQGKPKLASSLEIEFNLSHSEEVALLAIGQKNPLGIDIEFFSARPWLGIAKNLFSSAENEALLALPRSLQPLAFFDIWSQKEAFIKASGLGLSYPTQEFSVPVLSSKTAEVEDKLHQCSWRLTSFMPQIACKAALCSAPLIKEFAYCCLDNKKMALFFKALS